MLICGVPAAWNRRNQSGRYISSARAASTPPRSITRLAGQPNDSRSARTSALAPSSSPATKMLWSPGTRPGSTITFAFTVFSDLTTRASGNSRWICSATESVLQTVRLGGNPCEKSSGFETSTTTLPARLSAPAIRSAFSDTDPPVALKISSPCAAAASKLRAGSREPTFTSCPSSVSFASSVCPTTPVPSIPILMGRPYPPAGDDGRGPDPGGAGGASNAGRPARGDRRGQRGLLGHRRVGLRRDHPRHRPGAARRGGGGGDCDG